MDFPCKTHPPDTSLITQASCPSVLVSVFFIKNYVFAALLMSQLYSFTAAIVSGPHLHLFLASQRGYMERLKEKIWCQWISTSWHSAESLIGRLLLCVLIHGSSEIPPHSFRTGVRNLSKIRDASMICQCFHCIPPHPNTEFIFLLQQLSSLRPENHF